jgi:D-alanyl-D-alanine carboxypeptidase
MRHILLVFLIVCGLGLNRVCAQERDFSRLDQFLDSLESHDKFMGTLRISSEDGVAYERGVGFVDVDSKSKATADTRYRIGSITKMFTAAMVMKAIDSGKLSLGQMLADFYPQIPNSEQITISQLLQHRSGIHNFTNDSIYQTYYKKPITEEKLVEIISEGGSDFAPDSKGDYSNSNFVLLTFILEKVYGKPYSKLLEEHITGPLNLKSTYVFSSIDLENNEAYSYNYEDGWVKDGETDPSIPLGAGSIVSTTADLDTFVRALFSGKLISEQSLRSMMETKEGFGRGLFSFPYYEKKSYGHTGGIDGFRSFLAYFPPEKLTVAVLSNGMNYDNNEILLATLDTYFGKEITIPEFRTIVLRPEELGRYAGSYSSEQIPLKFTIAIKGKQLSAQATGQPEIILEATDAHTFEFRPVRAVFVFDVDKGEFNSSRMVKPLPSRRTEPFGFCFCDYWKW